MANAGVLITTALAALAAPDFNMPLGMWMPLKKASLSDDGKINKVIDRKDASFEFSGSVFSNPVVKPTVTEIITKNGANAQALSGARKGDVEQLSPRFLRVLFVIVYIIA
jgi:hypothetical protein